MRIMVALAVENEAMCEQLYYANKGLGGAGGDGYACSHGDSFNSLKRQLDNLKAWAADPKNSPWMEIAYSAADARRIINNDKLAIILGIEAEYAFGAEDRTFDPVDRLNEYYDLGVRTFYLAHKINSRLAGADVYFPSDSMPGKAIRVTQALSGCYYYDDNVGHFPLEGWLGKDLCDNYKQCGANAFKAGTAGDRCTYKLSEVPEAKMTDFIATRGGKGFNGFAIYPETPGFISKGGSRTDKQDVERNNLGLSYDGERVVREAMLKGMIVNIDHVSSRGREKMYEIATKIFDNYPLNALHNKPNRMLSGNKGFKPHEYDLDNHELDYIKSTGGFFGFRMGPTDSQEYPKSGISGKSANCSNTSTESAKMLAYLIDYKLPVGYALDYGTTTQGVHSRTMAGCDLDDRFGDLIHRYVDEQKADNQQFVAEGISHIGMMKQWHKELESIRLDQKYVDTLKFDGVEGFLGMWEKSEAASGSGGQVDRIRIIPDVEPH
jgi:microsomal dipeptidase-like Zn-dependent dipeptidase